MDYAELLLQVQAAAALDRATAEQVSWATVATVAVSRIAELPHCRSLKFPTSPGTPMVG
jgi:hypothetical protein